MIGPDPGFQFALTPWGSAAGIGITGDPRLILGGGVDNFQVNIFGFDTFLSGFTTRTTKTETHHAVL